MRYPLTESNISTGLEETLISPTGSNNNKNGNLKASKTNFLDGKPQKRFSTFGFEIISKIQKMPSISRMVPKNVISMLPKRRSR